VRLGSVPLGLTLHKLTSNITVEFGGIKGGLPAAPKASSGGIVIYIQIFGEESVGTARSVSEKQ
jgi:hypothetical protein